MSRWNHNIHYHRLVLGSLPEGARTALDVGCGDGLLAAELHRHVPEVTGIDRDPRPLVHAREEDPGVTWILGDALTHPFPREFDVVSAVAVVHHLPDLEAALRRLASLTSAGGVLVVIGLARSSRVRDLAADAAGVVAHQWLARRRGVWEGSAPTVCPPPHDFDTVRRLVPAVLPGATWRRLALFRYAIVWHQPTPA